MKSFRTFYLSEAQAANWKQYLANNEDIKDAVEILNILTKDNKYIAFIVGGAVRDIVMGNEPNDVDIATNFPIEEIEKQKLFPTHDIGDNKSFSIIVIEYKGKNIEVANFRSEKNYSDGRHPDKVEIVNDAKEDAERRDFTFNAMYIDAKGEIFDPFGGQEDIKNKILRTVGDPQQRFSEDYLRMLRAIRFASRFGFTIESETLQAIKDNADKITGISTERILKEFMGMAKLTGEKFVASIRNLENSGLLSFIIPELDIKLTEPVNNNHNSNDPLLNFSILFHSLPFQTIEKICNRLKFETEQKLSLSFVAKNYQKLIDFLKLTTKEQLDLIEHKYFKLLENTANTTKPENWNAIENKIKELRTTFSGPNSLSNIKLKVNGDRIMKLTGIKPGPQLGKLMNDTITWIVNNNITEQPEIDEYISKNQ